MASEVRLPRLGQGMESGTIVKWLKGEGEPVEKGEPLYELDTEKVTQEVEADDSGVLLRIGVREGEVEVGRTIAWIGEAGEEVAADGAAPGPADTSGATEVEEVAEEEGSPGTAREDERERGRRASPDHPVEGTEEIPSVETPSSNGGRVKASPLARRIARERGVDLARLTGTGPEGRVVAEDVERAAASEAPAAASVPVSEDEVESLPLSNVRRTIARRLTEAWQIPVFQLVVSAEMTRANELIRRRRELDPDVRLTVTDLLTKVCASALMRHRGVNVQFTDDALLAFPGANIGLAVSTLQGLVVPVLPDAHRLTLGEIAKGRADLVERAREGKLKRADLDGGTFTISNLGMYGVEQFTAVLNPPQAAILAVGATHERAVPLDGELVIQPLLTLTLTVDHRAVDGAPAAEFLRTVKESLEEPGLLL